MVAAACTTAGSYSGTTDVEDGAAALTTVPTTTPTTTTTTSTATTSSVSMDMAMDTDVRLEDFIPGSVIGPQTAEEASAMAREAEELTAACMAERGYEYTPFVQGEGELFSTFGFDETFAKSYGFGIVRDLFGETFLGKESPGEEDPNSAITEAMTPAEQDGYFVALYGQGPDIDSETMTQDEIDAAYESYVPDGCRGLAEQQVYGGGPSDGSAAFYEEFGDDLEAVYASMESDPRSAEVDAAWSTCMADLGYGFTEEADAYEYIHDELFAIGAIEKPADAAFGYAAMPIEAGSELEAQVKAIAEEEVEIAMASIGCSDHMWNLFEDLRREGELRFILEHRDELEQFKADHTS